MTTRRRNFRAPLRPAQSRGSVYLLVLATAAIAAAAALGAIAMAQSAQRTQAAQSSWNSATFAARSGLEIALARINQDTLWRSSIASGLPVSVPGLPGTQLDILYVDETDANFAAGNDPVRVYARATVASGTRVLSTLLEPLPPAPLPALNCTIYSAKPVRLNSSLSSAGGPIASGQRVTISSGVVLTGRVQAPEITNNGRVVGFVTTGTLPKAMPAADIYNTIRNRGVAFTIPGSSTNYINALWSSTRPPVTVAASPAGIYVINVPNSYNLSLSNMRIKATLVVNLGANASFRVENSVLWEPHDDTLPSLIVSAQAGAQVVFEGSNSPLTESAATANFNPVDTPYNGISDSARDGDTYPSTLFGLYHIIGPTASVVIQSDAHITGSVISEAPITCNDTVTLSTSQTLISSPPVGYTDPVSHAPARGEYRWESVESFTSAIEQ